MFTGNMKESKQSIIELHQVQLDAFMAVLEFLYTGHLAIYPNADPFHQLLLGDLFLIESLQQACIQAIPIWLSPENFCRAASMVMEVALQY
jgi:hypothetical protein